MSELEIRIKAQDTIEQYLSALMIQNNIPAHIMEDALNKCLVTFQKASFQEYLTFLESNKEEQDMDEKEE